jgi:hypothetical protein
MSCALDQVNYYIHSLIVQIQFTPLEIKSVTAVLAIALLLL